MERKIRKLSSNPDEHVEQHEAISKEKLEDWEKEIKESSNRQLLSYLLSVNRNTRHGRPRFLAVCTELGQRMGERKERSRDAS